MEQQERQAERFGKEDEGPCFAAVAAARVPQQNQLNETSSVHQRCAPSQGRRWTVALSCSCGEFLERALGCGRGAPREDVVSGKPACLLCAAAP